jgi:hypothetical protein
MTETLFEKKAAGHPLTVRFQSKKDGSLQLVNYEFVHECSKSR